MADGVLLDTSFLIVLADKNRPNHKTARHYWRHFLQNGIPIYLSTIAVSEFAVRQQIPNDILRSCVVLPFNWENAQRTASLHNLMSERQPEESRSSVKDDLKLIAQADTSGAEFAITDDSRTFYRYCELLRERGEVEFTPIRLQNGFDSSHFDPNKQSDFLGDLDNSDAEGEGI